MAGPSLNLYYSDQTNPIAGYNFVANMPNHHQANNLKYSRRIGWTVGLNMILLI
jgi:hypothetical protein